MKALAIFILDMTALHSARAAPTDSELMALAAREARSAGQHWSLPGEVVASTGDQILSDPSGQIRVPIAALRETLGGASDDNVGQLTAWLMAHEVWHQHQYRRGLTLAASDAVKRMSECEADMMAAHYLTDARLGKLGSAPSDAAAQDLAAAIRQIVAALQRLESGYDGTFSHPTGDQRLLAVRTGAGRAVQERLVELANDAEARFTRDRMATIYDIRAGESVQPWASRSCSLILHNGDGVTAVARDKPVISWNKSGDPPVVDFSVPYRNRSDRPVRVTMQVRSASIPRDQREDKVRWSYADAKFYQFDLQPGATYHVNGRLDWYASDTAMPRLLYPVSDGSMFNATLLSEAQPTTPPAPTSDLPKDLSDLKIGLQAIYTDAFNRFRTVAPTCPPEDGDEYCPLKLKLPGVISGEGTRYGDGSSDVDLLIYEGNSESDADAAYRGFKEKLIRIYPAVAIPPRPVTPEREQITMRPVPRAELRLTKRKRDSGEYVVTAVITPELN